MRKLTVGIATVAILAGSLPPPTLAQERIAAAKATTPTVDAAAQIALTLKAFPNGGEPLKLAITDLVVQHPNLASTLAAQLRSDQSLSPAQREAAIAGLAAALNKLGIVAQAGNLDPMVVALILGATGLGVLGIYEATRNSGGTTSPN